MQKIYIITLLCLNASFFVIGTGDPYVHRKDKTDYEKQGRYRTAIDLIENNKYPEFTAHVQQNPNILNPNYIFGDIFLRGKTPFVAAIRCLIDPQTGRERFLNHILPNIFELKDGGPCDHGGWFLSHHNNPLSSFRWLLETSCKSECSDDQFTQQCTRIKLFIDLAKDVSVYPDNSRFVTTLQRYITEHLESEICKSNLNRNGTDTFPTTINRDRFNKIIALAHGDIANKLQEFTEQQQPSSLQLTFKDLAHSPENLQTAINAGTLENCPDIKEILLLFFLQQLDTSPETAEASIRTLLATKMPLQREHMVHTISQAWSHRHKDATSPQSVQSIAALTTFVQLIKNSSLDQKLTNEFLARYPSRKGALTPHIWLEYFAMETLNIMDLRSYRLYEMLAEWEKALDLPASKCRRNLENSIRTFDSRRSVAQQTESSTSSAACSSSSAACSSNQAE